MERHTTGIEGLDDKIQGGFINGSVNLVVGKTGTGKTQFCASFLYAGALKGEPGVYITTEEREDDIKGDMTAMFGWNLEAVEQKKLLKFESIKPIYPDKPLGDDINRITRSYLLNLTNKIAEAIKAVNAKRVVLDSISILEMFIQDKYTARVALMGLTEHLRQLGVTTVLTGEIGETSDGLSGSGIIEYLVDSVIRLDFVPVSEDYKRTITIRKMRRTNHSTLIHPFDMTPDGLKLIKI
ncbi:MAG: AAA family ATPase [Candidatus Aenigmarchaeota archaeon]|nr:AAA family ATPase [Candidatus Aenigmarchaeota archaeon]